MSREERNTDPDRDLEPIDEERTDERRRTGEPRDYSGLPETGEHGTFVEQGGPMGRDNAWSEQHDEEIRKQAEAQRKQWHEAATDESNLSEGDKAAADRARGRGGQGPVESGA